MWSCDYSQHLEYCWCGAYCKSDRKRDDCCYITWADAVQEGIVYPNDQNWCFVAGNQWYWAPETYQMVCNSSRICNNASFACYVIVHLAPQVCHQFHHWYSWMATYWHWERGISMNQHIQLNLTYIEAQWPVYHSWLYGEDAVVSY